MKILAITSVFAVSQACPGNGVRLNLCKVFVFFWISLTLFMGYFCDLGVYVNMKGSTTLKIGIC
jgi:hypothetical protein